MFKINDYLRKQVRLLQGLQGISQKELAEYLEITQDSFWSWLHGYFDLGKKKQERLQDIIGSLAEYDLDKLLFFYDQYDFQEDELLRPIIEYYSKGRYYITNYGHVVSLCQKQWRELTQNIDEDGYYYVSFEYNGKRVKKRIHRLVAENFVANSKPEERTIVHHRDGNRRNNHYSNLVWCSPQEHGNFHSKGAFNSEQSKLEDN